MKKIGLYIILIAALLLPQFFVLAQDAGFVPSDIWYSKDPFQEGDKIKIYTVLFNPDTREFSGTVRFFDRETLLGKKDFKVGAKQIKDISIDWTVTAGSHAIYAKIENAKFLVSTGKYEPADLSETQTDESKRTVSRKITTADKEGETGGDDEGPFKTIENLEEFIAEKTPSIVAKPIIAAASGVEGFRTSVGESSKASQEMISAQLKQEPEKNAARLDRPIKHIKVFFLRLVSLVFNNKVIFYGLSLVLLFFILRLIWRRIFA